MQNDQKWPIWYLQNNPKNVPIKSDAALKQKATAEHFSD